MTKGEWKNLKIGTKVFAELPIPTKQDEDKLILVDGAIIGEVIDFNFGASQAKIRWVGGGESWKGRLGIEIYRAKCSHKLSDKSYSQWHEWAEKQYKAGKRQKQCPNCKLWLWPSEY